MSNLKMFQTQIKNINSKWNSNSVYFSQMRDGYSATYKPRYPDDSKEDMIIQTLFGTGAENRGNYELIIWEECKFCSKYFRSISEIKKYFNTL